MFVLTIHVRRCLCIYFHLTCFCCFSVLFFLTLNKKKNGEEDAEFLFFLLIAFHILHVFLPDISVYCALIKYAYI
jgi:heme/copper-type cytochrome/quinol oxidase subunit 3